jgi:putative GTP pyrophosphokinase
LEHKYREIAGILKGVFEDKLGLQNINYSRISYRIKSYDSFLLKAERKKYKLPFQEIDDICGFRIVLRNSADMKEILDILKNEFEVKESLDKYEDLKPDQFGYRSHHIILQIKESWLVAPQFREAKNLRFEIQVRSELMDAWANISHQIFYKSQDIEKK